MQALYLLCLTNSEQSLGTMQTWRDKWSDSIHRIISQAEPRALQDFLHSLLAVYAPCIFYIGPFENGRWLLRAGNAQSCENPR